eukprot:5789226-Pyramimonas_sp.AAC.1
MHDYLNRDSRHIRGIARSARRARHIQDLSEQAATRFLQRQPDQARQEQWYRALGQYQNTDDRPPLPSILPPPGRPTLMRYHMKQPLPRRTHTTPTSASAK